jgi:hypothetical protein
MAGGLTPEQRWALIKAHGSVENARDEALTRSPELQELWQTQYAWDSWPRGEFWKMFWKIALPVLGISPTELEEGGARPGAESPPLPPLPNGVSSYTHATLEKAVKVLDADGTAGDVERKAKLPPPDARRVRALKGTLLRLNRDGKLVVDARVARDRSRYVLRYLDATRSHWLDPNRERPQS